MKCSTSFTCINYAWYIFYSLTIIYIQAIDSFFNAKCIQWRRRVIIPVYKNSYNESIDAEIRVFWITLRLFESYKLPMPRRCSLPRNCFQLPKQFSRSPYLPFSFGRWCSYWSRGRSHRRHASNWDSRSIWG